MSGVVIVGESGVTSFRPKRPVAGKYPIVLAHGWQGNSRSWFNVTGWYTSIWTRIMAQAGFSMASFTFGDGFGAPSEAIDMETCRTWFGTNMPWVDNSKVVIVGMSMGNANAWAARRDNPTRVAGILGLMPLSDLPAVRMIPERLAGVNASIDAAWGVAYPAALPAAANFIAQGPTLKGIPYRAYYSTADTVVLPSEVQALAAAVEGEAIAAGTGAHGDAIMASVPTQGCIDFLRSCGA